MSKFKGKILYKTVQRHFAKPHEFNTARIIRLESVGAGIDFSTLNTYAMTKEGYALAEPVHLSQCVEIWFEGMSEADQEAVAELLKFHELKRQA